LWCSYSRHGKVYEVWTYPVIKVSHIVISKSHPDVFGEEICEVTKNKYLVASLLESLVGLYLIDLDILFEVEVEIGHFNLIVVFDK